MNTNPLKEGLLTENSAGIGTVSRAMLRERALELAAIDGRPAGDVSKADWEHAKSELSGVANIDSKEAVLDAAPESARWDPVHGSTGHKVPVAAGEDEDEEGRSDREKLTDEGMAGAEHDQMRQASLKLDE